jgi:hypothetical protein
MGENIYELDGSRIQAMLQVEILDFLLFNSELGREKEKKNHRFSSECLPSRYILNDTFDIPAIFHVGCKSSMKDEVCRCRKSICNQQRNPFWQTEGENVEVIAEVNGKCFVWQVPYLSTPSLSIHYNTHMTESTFPPCFQLRLHDASNNGLSKHNHFRRSGDRHTLRR